MFLQKVIYELKLLTTIFARFIVLESQYAPWEIVANTRS